MPRLVPRSALSPRGHLAHISEADMDEIGRSGCSGWRADATLLQSRLARCCITPGRPRERPLLLKMLERELSHKGPVVRLDDTS